MFLPVVLAEASPQASTTLILDVLGNSLARHDFDRSVTSSSGVPADENRYTPGEEIANSVTHGVGAGLSIAALSILVTYAGSLGDVWRMVSFSIYGATLVLLYLASTFYHGFRSPRLKGIFRVLDHSAIFLLIAGTYTPFMLVSLRGGWGWTLFGVVWGLALCGILLEVFFMDRYKVLTMVLYIGTGWVAIVALKPLLSAVPPGGLLWLGVGGITYTLGVIFYLWEGMPYNHAIWHLFVLGGSVCHFFCILFYVLPVHNA